MPFTSTSAKSKRQGTSRTDARFTNDMDSLGLGIKMLFGKVVAEPLKALSCHYHRLLHQLAVTLMSSFWCRSPPRC